MGYCASMETCSFRVKTENTGRVLKKLEHCGYVAELDDNGNVVDLDFVSEKLAYDEDSMFQQIAPYVESGSFIEMRGEDGTMWRQIFRDGKCREVKANVSWPEE